MVLHLTSKQGFYVGDPCYVLDDSNYYGIIGDRDGWRHGPHLCKALDGSELNMADDHTAWGDGEYTDNLGNFYPVDAGILGAVPLELCWQKGKQLTVAALNKLGQFFPGTECEFDTDGEGSFSFTIKDDGKETYVEILTRDDGEEEDEDDDWGDEEEEWEDPEDEYPDYRGYGEEDY